MIMKDLVTDLILKMDVFITKKGQDIETQKKLIDAINALTGENSLDAIYINNTDNFNIPDVFVAPLYNKDFNLFLMDGDYADTCPFGYTVEIHERCFSRLTAEELTALIIHDILQNVQSCSAKTRFLKAYNHVISQYDSTKILDLFDDISNSEVVYMAFVDICARPFRVPVEKYDYLGTDEVLRAMNLGDAYDSYLEKIDKNTENLLETSDDIIDKEVHNDFRTMKTIINACFDKDIRHYYNVIRTGVPSVTLDHVFGKKGTVASLGFISKKRNFNQKYVPTSISNKSTTMITESFMNPRNEIELRFQVDKIISDMRYAESESEREVILFQIKTLSLKLLKLKEKLDADYQKNPANKSLPHKRDFCQNLLDELDMLREKTLKMEIKPRTYGLFVKYPTGYSG